VALGGQPVGDMAAQKAGAADEEKIPGLHGAKQKTV
jgi:hypothetical protein